MSLFALRRHGLLLKTAVIGAAVVGSSALGGCGAGQITQTSTQVSAVDGASATVGQIGVRNVSIIFASTKNAAVYPAGGAAPLQLSIINFGNADDKLVSASSTVAGSVTITGDPRIASGRTLRISGGAGATEEGGGAASSATATASAGASATASSSPGPTRSAAPTPSATPTASAAPTTAATPTPGADGTTSASIVLTGLKQDIRAGLTYPVEFTFANAGKVTIQVPVANPSAPRSASAE